MKTYLDCIPCIGMSEIADIIETGSNGIGVHWDALSQEFLEEYRAADLIVSKGQGNFETMDGKEGNIFFLLMAKCECVAEELGVRVYDTVLASNRRRSKVPKS